MKSLIGQIVLVDGEEWTVTDQPEHDPGLVRVQFVTSARWLRVKDIDILPEQE